MDVASPSNLSEGLSSKFQQAADIRILLCDFSFLNKKNTFSEKQTKTHHAPVQIQAKVGSIQHY